MSDCEFHSCLREYMESFVALRRMSGTDYQSQTKLLKYFDNFLRKENLRATFLSQGIVDSYLSSISHLSPRSQQNRLSVIRQFCCHLSLFESHCYIPELRSIKNISSTSYMPFIFSKDQVRRLLATCSSLLPENSLRPYTYRMLFGLLYTTGLRVREALFLDIHDLHLESNRLYVRKGKFSKQRWVPLSTSTCSMLIKYLAIRQNTLAITPDAPLFINLKFKRLNYSNVNYTFNCLLNQCNITESKTSKPVIYSFRHSFATHRLLEWYQDGKDINSRLPALATYMGHVDIRSTQAYLHATAELLEQTNQKFLAYFRQNIVKGSEHE